MFLDHGLLGMAIAECDRDGYVVCSHPRPAAPMGYVQGPVSLVT